MYPKYERSEAEKEQILSTYRERAGMRGVVRLYHISRNTLKRILKKSSRAADCPREPPTCRRRRNS